MSVAENGRGNDRRGTPLSERVDLGQPAHAHLAALTFVTGLLDAVTYLGLGHIFAANQTGNIIVLGFALVGADQISVTASLASLVFFVIGAAFSGWAASALEHSLDCWLLVMFACEACLLGIASLTTALPVLAAHTEATVSMLALAMGMRSVTVQRMGIGGVSTTVLTMTLATLAGDVLLRGTRWTSAQWDAARPRLAAVAAVLLGAATGAALLQYGATLVLTLATAISVGVAVGLAVSRRARLARARAARPGAVDCQS
jgi:uncharacterized membrane protein YoaK (UPF0700 family)